MGWQSLGMDFVSNKWFWCLNYKSKHHWDLMLRHDRGSCYNFIVHAPVCTKLYMFDKSPGLNTSTWQYSISDANWLNSVPYEIAAKQPQQQAKQWTKEVMFISVLHCLKTARIWRHLHARERSPLIVLRPDVRGGVRARSTLIAALIKTELCCLCPAETVFKVFKIWLW